MLPGTRAAVRELAFVESLIPEAEATLMRARGQKGRALAQRRVAGLLARSTELYRNLGLSGSRR